MTDTEKRLLEMERKIETLKETVASMQIDNVALQILLKPLGITPAALDVVVARLDRQGYFDTVAAIYGISADAIRRRKPTVGRDVLN